MKYNRLLLRFTLVVLAAVIVAETSLANKNDYNGPKKTVHVSDLDELYAAVNNPDNAGTTVVLAPGIYALSAGYPNAGRLELQQDMSLQGQPGQIDAVLIDQSSLPNSSFRLSPTVSVAPIRIGRGANSIEWLSVKGGALSANPLSVIESDLLGATTDVLISHVYVDCNGSRTGILFRNRLEEHADRVINAALEYTEISNAVNSPGAGLALQNRISGSQIKLDMNGNYIHDSRIGIFNFNSGLNNPVEYCLLDMSSHNDRIEGNGCGMDLTGGTSGSAGLLANNNTVSIKMYAASIRGNGQPDLTPTNGALLSGIYAAGAWGSTNASNNVLTVELWGSDISNNNATDIYAYGAFSPTALLAGTENRFDLYLFGMRSDPSINSSASVPFEPLGTNVMNIVRK